MKSKKNKEWLFGYQSDFSYKLLKTDTTVDYENPLMIDENIIDTVQKYVEKEKRPIVYNIGYFRRRLLYEYNEKFRK